MLAPGLKNRFAALVAVAGLTWWTTTLGAQDARLATEAARGTGRNLRLASTVHDLYQVAADTGVDGDDIAVAQLYR